MLDIKVLGPGCSNCRKLEAVTREAIAQSGLPAELEKVTDMLDILRYDLLATPGLVVNGKVLCSGRIPTVAEVRQWLEQA